MQIGERRQDAQDVGDRLGHRQRAPGFLTVPHPKVAEGFAADVPHDDVAGAVVLDEVLDPDDVGVVDLGEEPLLGRRRGHGGRVAGVEQALEHDPGVLDVLVLGQVDPAQSAMGQAPGDQVLATDEVARPEFRGEGIVRTAVGAEALGPGRPLTAGPSDGVIAPAAKPLALGHLRVGQDCGLRITFGHRRHVHQPGPEVPTAAGRARTSGRGDARVRPGAHPSDGARPLRARRDGPGGRRWRWRQVRERHGWWR